MVFPHSWRLVGTAVALLLATAGLVQAEVRLPAVISDHMLLQQGVPARVWGWAGPDETVQVQFRGRSYTATAPLPGESGDWEVFLAPSEAGGPFRLEVRGSNTIAIEDVLVGDVWVASGQSNMDWSVRRSRDPDEEIAQANFPRIRLFKVARNVADEPLEDVEGAWQPCTPESVEHFSAVGYYFARHLHRKLGHPVGVIQTAWGGTPAQAWVSRPHLESDPALTPALEKWQQVLAEYPERQKEHLAEVARWEREAAAAKKNGEPVPRRPRRPFGPGHPWTPGGLFNAMISPLVPYAVRGAIWYQGETNAHLAEAHLYRSLFPALIQDWRAHWRVGPFPFLFVQLANFRKTPEGSEWPELREAQLMTLGVRNTGMAVTIDIGNPEDIHPKNKQDVGKRLALAARALAHGEDLVYSGPVFRRVTTEGTGLRVWFDHVGGGLESREGDLTGFEVAGADRRFVSASARIDSGNVVVSSPEVERAVAVRYGWSGSPVCNLYNAEGLPASPFRSDDWE